MADVQRDSGPVVEHKQVGEQVEVCERVQGPLLLLLLLLNSNLNPNLNVSLYALLT